MKTITLFEQDGNRSVGIYKDNAGKYLALTFLESKDFKTLRGAEKWLSKRGYK